MPPRRTHRLTTLLWSPAFVAIGLFVLFWAFRSWLVLTFPFQVEYGEGPVADWVRTIARGHLPYKPIQSEPWTFSVYTPLYLFAAAALLGLGVPLWMSGRLISLAGAAGLAVLVFVLVRRGARANHLAAPLAATALFLASPYLARWATFYRPDMMGLFLSGLGLALIVPALQPGRGALVGLAGLCFAAAALTKQSFISAPLAALLFLALTAPRRALSLLFSMAAIGGVAVLGLAVAAGPGALWADLVIGNANPFDPASFLRFLRSFARISAILIGLAVLALWQWPRTREWNRPGEELLLGLYALISLLSTVSAGKAGAWENYFLEPFFVLCVLAGRALRTLATRPGTVGVVAGPLLVLLQLVLFLPGFERFGPLAEQPWLAELRDERTALAAAVDAVPIDRPVLSEDLGVLPATGRPVFMHTFVYTQLARQGDFDQTPLLADIGARRFPLVIERRGALEDRLDLERWTPEMLAAIERAYVAERTAGDWLLFRPAPDLWPLDLPLNPRLHLRGWTVEVNGRAAAEGPVAVQPGDRLRVHLLWERLGCAPADSEECSELPPGGEQSFVHLLDWQDQKLAQSDAPPRHGTVALTAPRDALIHDTHTITVPESAEPGALPLLVGAYRLVGDRIEPLGPPQRLTGLKIALPEEPGPSLPAPDAGAVSLGPLSLAAVTPLPADVRPGAILTLTADWQARERPAADLTTFLHILPGEGDDGQPIAQQDQRPLGGRYPTTVWAAGERVQVRYEVELPGALPSGGYQVRLGWYDPATNQRLPGAEGGSILVGTVTVP